MRFPRMRNGANSRNCEQLVRVQISLTTTRSSFSEHQVRSKRLNISVGLTRSRCATLTAHLRAFAYFGCLTRIFRYSTPLISDCKASGPLAGISRASSRISPLHVQCAFVPVTITSIAFQSPSL